MRDKPFIIRVDWICHDAYGSAVEVILHPAGEAIVLRTFTDIGDAVAWTGKWLRDRGGTPWCNFGWHEHMGHKYLDVYSTLPEVNPHPKWAWDCPECNGNKCDVCVAALD